MSASMEHKCEFCHEVPVEADTLSCFHVVCHKHVVNAPGDAYVCPVPSCKAMVDKSKISTSAIAASFNEQQKASQKTLCENCEKDRKDVAVAWCFECYGFFCAADDDKIHAIGIFRHHQRDYDAQSFATYTAQKLAGLTIDEMLMAAGRLKSVRQVDNRVQSRFGNIGGKIPTLRSFAASASAGGSGVATPVSGKTAGLSLGSVTGTSTAGACLLHGQPFSRFCQSHMRVVCEQCIEELERPNATLGKTCAVQDLFKTSKTECTKACRSWLTRHAMFGAISKLRKQIDAEIKALNELLGNDGNRSVFFHVHDRIDAQRAQISASVHTHMVALNVALEARMGALNDAAHEAHLRQLALLEQQHVRLAYCEHFNANLIRIGRYLAEKETIECLEINELERIQSALEHYKQVRVNEIPYAIGATELELDPSAAAAQLATLLKVTDEAEDDTFASGRVVESQVHAADTLYEVHRLLSSSSDQVQVRDVGAGDFGYFFAVRVLKVGGADPSLRIGFISKGSNLKDEQPLGAQSSTASFAFECATNGELKLAHSSDRGKTVEVSLQPLMAFSAGSKSLPPSSQAWTEGSVVGCFFDRRKNTAQVFVNGALSEEVSLRKIGLKFDVEAANPCICLAQQGDVVRIEFARFVPDVAAVTKLAQLQQ